MFCRCANVAYNCKCISFLISVVYITDIPWACIGLYFDREWTIKKAHKHNQWVHNFNFISFLCRKKDLQNVQDVLNQP